MTRRTLAYGLIAGVELWALLFGEGVERDDRRAADGHGISPSRASPNSAPSTAATSM